MTVNVSPCKDCKDRHMACWDKCAKYAHWKAELQKVKDAEKEYKRKRRDDFLMSEQCEAAKKSYAKSKYGKINRRG